MSSVLLVLFPISLLLFILLGIRKSSYFKNAPFSSKSLQWAFVFKVISGLILISIYTFYYQDRSSADVFKYFDDGKILYQSTQAHPIDFVKIMIGQDTPELSKNHLSKMSYWYRSFDHGLRNDNRIVIKFNALFCWITGGNYLVHALIFCLLSFIGLFELGKLFYSISGSKIISYFAAFLVPSTLFWTSGILKEALLIFAIGVFCSSMFHLLQKFKISYFFCFLFSLYLLLSIKIYVLFALLPAAILWFTLTKTKDLKWRVISFFIFPLLVYVLPYFFFPQFNFLSLLIGKQHDFINLANTFHAGSTIKMEALDSNIWSLIAAIPKSLFQTISMPWPTQIKGVIYLMPFFENLLIFSMLTMLIFLRKKLNSMQIHFLWFGVLFTIILFSIIGLTTPVIGAIVRYKVPAMPFLFFILLSAIDFSKISKHKQNSKILKWINTYL